MLVPERLKTHFTGWVATALCRIAGGSYGAMRTAQPAARPPVRRPWMLAPAPAHLLPSRSERRFTTRSRGVPEAHRHQPHVAPSSTGAGSGGSVVMFHPIRPMRAADTDAVHEIDYAAYADGDNPSPAGHFERILAGDRPGTTVWILEGIRAAPPLSGTSLLSRPNAPLHGSSETDENASDDDEEEEDNAASGRGNSDLSSARAPCPSIAGHIEMAWIDARTAYVASVCVHPAWRRLGVAQRLMEHVMAEYHARGAERIVLHVRESNVGARALYVRLGFVNMAPAHLYPVPPSFRWNDGLTLQRCLPYAVDA